MSINITITDLEDAGREALIRVASLISQFAKEPVSVRAVTDEEGCRKPSQTLGEVIKRVIPHAAEPEQSTSMLPATEVIPEPPIRAFGVELDSAGIPWDGRIHASSRAKVAGGVWRSKRGVDPAVITAVSAELRAAMLAPPIAPTAAAPVVPQIPMISNTAGSVPPVPSPTNNSITTFPEFMQRVTAGYAQGTITQPAIAEALKSVGITSLPLLGARPDLIPEVAKSLGLLS